VWIVRASPDTATAIQSEKERNEKGAEKMAHRKLTTDQQLKGVQAALRSPRTPPQLKDGLRRREKTLLGMVDRSKKRGTGKKSLLQKILG
jgi:hypothetical protein